MKGGELVINDSHTNIIALLASNNLSSDGKAIFLLPETFYNYEHPDGVVANLAEFGLHINAIVSIPQNSLSPWTALSSSLFLISRKKTNDLFVGRLSEESDTALLVSNLINRKNGQTIELGRLINPLDYKSWRQYLFQTEVEQAVKNSKLPAIKLEEIATKINIGDTRENGGFDDLPNTFYLPVIDGLFATTRLSDLNDRPLNYVQIILDPEIALADYVAGYFNTDLGRKVRASISSGSIVTKLLKIDLMDALVLLPSMEVQQKVTEAQRTISELVLGLGKLEKSLFQSPYEVTKIEKQITKLNQKESFEAWIDTLPFPLASILWRYHANIDTDEKIKHLLHFFEGTTHFVTTIMLSAFYSDTDVFRKYRQSFFSTTDSSITIKRSTFGNWVTIGEKVAKSTRRMLSDPQEIPVCLGLYKTESLEFINTIANRELFSVFRNALKYRNDFAHGGIENALINKRKLNLLESELNNLRVLFATTFDGVVLMKSVNNQYRDGFYTNKISKIMGSRQFFADDTLATSIPLDSGKLYIGHKDSTTPLEVLPFIKLTSNPESDDNACYFYNRVENGQVRWVSYHYEQQPEITLGDTSLIKLIEALESVSKE